MVFNRKGSFFLDLSGEGDGTTSSAKPQPTVQVAPVQVAPPKQNPAKAQPSAQKPAAGKGAKPADASTPAPATPDSGATGGGPALTTAEAIASELAAAQANRPAPSNATFAPECLAPSGALPRRRRRGGANLAGFRSMAASLLRS